METDLSPFGIPQAIFRMHQRKRAAADSGRPPRSATSPFYASELGKCGRAITYQLLGFAGESFSGRSLRIFAAGDQMEETLVAELTQAGFAVANRQARISVAHPPVSGKIDGTISGKTQDGETVTRLLELKSMNARGFAELRRSSIEQAQPGYYTQVQVYLFALALQAATVVVGCKDDSDLYEETIGFDPAHVARQFIRLQAVRDASLAGRLADPEYQKSSWQCRYCAFRDHCAGLPATDQSAKRGRGGKATGAA